MKYFLFKKRILLFAIVILISCKDDDDMIFPACDVAIPVEQLTWLRSEIERREANPSEDMKYCYIAQAQFEGETFFVYGDCNPLIDKGTPIYNCEGSLVNLRENGVSLGNLEQERIIWRPANFVCNISF